MGGQRKIVTEQQTENTDKVRIESALANHQTCGFQW